MKLINCCIAAMLCLCQLRAQTVGSLDTSFGMDGITNVDDAEGDFYHDILLYEDGSFLLIHSLTGNGPVRISITKFNADGSIDNNFGINGKVLLQYDSTWNVMRDAKILSDGKILIGGDIGSFNRRTFFVRLMPDGTFDEAFGDNGFLEEPILHPYARLEKIAIQNSGKILTLADLELGHYLYRFNENGSIDESFENEGRILIPINPSLPYITKIAVEEDDTFLVYTIHQDFSTENLNVQKYLPDGAFDTSFADGGTLNLPLEESNIAINELAKQADGKFIFSCVTSSSFDPPISFLIRVSTNGEVDESFGINGVLNLTIDNTASFQLSDLFIVSNNELLVSGDMTKDGETTRILSRFVNGTLDTNFGEEGILHMSFPGDPTEINTYQLIPVANEKYLLSGNNEKTDNGLPDNIVIVRVFGDIDAAIGAPNQIDLDLKVIPNPVEDQLYFEFGLEEPTNLSASIYNSNGQLLFVAIPKERKTAGQHSMSCDVSHLPKGSYFLNLSTTEGEQSIQFIK